MNTAKIEKIFGGIAALLLLAGVFVVWPVNQSRVLGEQSAPTSAILWQYQCIDTMKYSRDAAREFMGKPENNKAFISKEVAEVRSLGANCIAIATPYDEEFIPVLSTWVAAAHEQGLVVWFRGNFSGWEGWFDHPKLTSAADHHALMKQFIIKHGNLFKQGDILTPAPEAENGLLGSPWQSEQSKQALRDFVIASYANCSATVKEVAAPVRCGFFSTNGDVAEKIYTLDTIHKIGAVTTIDHYVSSVERMDRDIVNLQKQKQAQVFLGEFGAPIPDINGNMTEAEQSLFVRRLFNTFYVRKNIITGVNYWVLRGGSTSLLNDDGSERAVTETVRDFYKPGVIRGTVMNTIGQPLGGVNIRTGDGVQSIKTDRKGQFSLTLPAGRTDLTFEIAGYSSQNFPVESIRATAITQTIELNPVKQSLWYKARLRARQLLKR
jgi:hypothetical protein